MGPIQTTTDELSLSPHSSAQDSTRLPSPLDSANNLTHLPRWTHPARSPEPLKATSRDSALDIINTNDQDSKMSDQNARLGETQDRPQQIIETLHKFIQDERIRNFRFLGRSSHQYLKQDELLVVSPANEDDIQDLRTGHRHLKTYKDDQWFTFSRFATNRASSRTVVVMAPEGSTISMDSLTVIEPYSRGSFGDTRAATWLHNKYDLEDAGAMKFADDQYKEQFMWWMGTGKAFRLLDLPAELRDAIYLQSLGPVIVPDLHASQTVVGRGLSYKRDRDSQKSRDPRHRGPKLSNNAHQPPGQKRNVASVHERLPEALAHVWARWLRHCKTPPIALWRDNRKTMAFISSADWFLPQATTGDVGYGLLLVDRYQAYALGPVRYCHRKFLPERFETFHRLERVGLPVRGTQA